MAKFNKHTAGERALKCGDIVYVPLFGAFRHYGIVIEAGNTNREPVIRTVHRDKKHPLNQNLTSFMAGKPLFMLRYSSQRRRDEVVQSALNIRKHRYNLFTNNCEHFCRRAHGLSDQSWQVIISMAALVVGSVLTTVLRARSSRS